jgi:hypothetical protein
VGVEHMPFSSVVPGDTPPPPHPGTVRHPWVCRGHLALCWMEDLRTNGLRANGCDLGRDSQIALCDSGFPVRCWAIAFLSVPFSFFLTFIWPLVVDAVSRGACFSVVVYGGVAPPWSP